MRRTFIDVIFEKVFKRWPKAAPYIRPLYLKFREAMLYGIVGIGTTFITLFLYWLLTEKLYWNILIANAFAWVFATMYAFLMNRKIVFSYHAKGVFAFFVQLFGFSAVRLITLGLEEVALGVLIGGFNLPNMWVKFFAQIVVIALNYILSKKLVFQPVNLENADQYYLEASNIKTTEVLKDIKDELHRRRMEKSGRDCGQ